MTLQHRSFTTGGLCEPKKYTGGNNVVLELASQEDPKKFSRIADGARLTKVGTTQDNVLSFSKIEEII